MATYQETVLADNPIYFWEADTKAGDNTLVDRAGLNNQVLEGVEDSDYLVAQEPLVRDILTATEIISGQGAIGGSVTDHPTGGFSLEFWFSNLDDISDAPGTIEYLYDFRQWDDTSGVLLYYLVSNGRVLLFLDIDSTATLASWDLGSPLQVMANDTPAHLVVTVESSGTVWCYFNGVNLGSQTESPQPLSASGQVSLFVRQDSLGVPEGGNGARAVFNGIAVYPLALSVDRVTAHYVAGDIFPLVAIEPVEPEMDVRDYWTVTVNPGSGEIIQTNIVADYDMENQAVYTSGIGWGDGWEGTISDAGGQVAYTFRAKENHPRKVVTIFAAASSDKGHAVSRTKQYSLCGFKEYPKYMNPSYDNIVDLDSCRIGCSS